jgi:outer membrane protein assembly factor BamB/predicted MPP superfamily phosphohydrolase
MAVQIRGKVYNQDSGEGVSEVLVSNGEQVVRTAGDGSYLLPAEVGIHPFVWVSLPAGMRASERFYQAVPGEEGEIDFALLPAPERGRPDFSLVQITDTHVEGEKEGRSSGEMLARDLVQLVDQARPDLIIHSGDLSNRGTQEELHWCAEAFESVEVPVFALFGNHDGSAEKRAHNGEFTCTCNFGQVFGPAYYSFDWGGRHFVLFADVDGFFTAADRQRKEAWLWADLEQQPAGRKSVVVVHMPPALEFVEQLGCFNVELVLFGHWHSSKSFGFAEVAVAATPPLCFGGIDTGARGYRLVEFSAQGVQLELKALQSPALRAQEPVAIILGEKEIPLQWKRQLPGELHRAAPVAWEDKILLSLRDEGGGKGGGVQCLDAGSGELRWDFRTDTSVKNNVAVDGEGRCTFVSATGRVWAVDVVTGNAHWQVDLPGYPDRWVHVAPVVTAGTVYVGAKGGYGAYDLDTGEQQWYTKLDDLDAFPFCASPLVWEDLLILLQQGRGLLGLQRHSGEIAWERELGTSYPYGAPVRAGALLVSGGDDKCLAVLRAESGEIVWQRPVLEAYPSGLAAGEDRIFVATPGGQIQCFELESGVLCWQFQTGADLIDMTPYVRGGRSILAAPLVWGEWVVVGGNDGVLYLLDAVSGACLGQTDFGAPIVAPPCLVGDGICVGTWDGRVYCFWL